MKVFSISLVASFVFCISVFSADAATVLPGGVAVLSGTTAAANPDLAGVSQNDNGISFDFSLAPFTDVGGSVQNRVTLSNNLAVLTFGPRIHGTFNLFSSEFQILGFQLDGYGGWETDIDFRTDGVGDKGPTLVSRSLDGNLLTFRYGDPLIVQGISPGLQEVSLFPSISTNASEFALTGSMTIFGIDTSRPNTVRSVTIGGMAVPVPEPFAAAMLGPAIGLLILRRRRRTNV